MMKKILSITLIMCIIALTSVTAFAATQTITVTSATFGSSATTLADSAAAAPTATRSDLFSNKAKISAPGEEVTILVVDASASLTNLSDSAIGYIDQVTADSAGVAEISFRMPLTAPAATYAVYVGGTDVATLATKYFKLEAASGTYLSGDVDGSTVVDSTDAIYVLRSSLGLSLPANVTIETGDVDGSSTVDSTDAIYILRYSLGLSLPANVTAGQEVTL